MANNGFRGNAVLIEQLVIAGHGGPPTLEVRVQFASEDGTVHAVAQHKLLVDLDRPGDDLGIALRDLLEGVTRRIEAIHFAQPRDAGQQLLQGIAETLRSAKSPDEPGTQG